MSDNKKVIIMQGLPGSGKTHEAYRWTSSEAKGGVEIVSADDFFTEKDDDGDATIYNFDVTKLGQAHADCMRRFLTCIEAKVPNIIVDNTNCQKWEFENYVRAARIAGYSVEYRQVHCDARELTVKDILTFAARNKHGVLAAAIFAMAARWEA